MIKSRYKIVFIFTINTIIIFGTITTGKTTLGSELSRLYNALFLNADSIWATRQRHVPSLLNPLGLSRPIAVMKHLLVSRQQADYVHSVIWSSTTHYLTSIISNHPRDDIVIETWDLSLFHYIRRPCIGIFLYNANRQAQIHRLRSRYGTITDQTACTLIDQQNLLLLQQMQTYCRNQAVHTILRVNTNCSIAAVIKQISHVLD